MEIAHTEVQAIIEVVQASQSVLELAELQLSLVGGGCGEVVLA
jgi:hypothetical protein